MTTRSRIDIISQILETVNSGVSTKIKIMYRANLSYEQLKDYLMTLYEMNLLTYDTESHTFKTTEKGLKFLEIYSKLDHILRGETRHEQAWHRWF